MTAADAKALLLSLLPNGYARWFDFSKNSFGDLILAGAADQLVARVATPAEIAALDNNPWTLTASGLAAWETALGFANSKVALFGSVADRRAAIVSRLRESGASTLPAIRAVIGPLLGYADPTQLEIVETTRSALTAANTYENNAGISIIGGGSIVQGVNVPDDGKVSLAGVRLMFDNPFISDTSDLVISVQGVTDPGKTWNTAADFASQQDPLVLFYPEAAGFQVLAVGAQHWNILVSSVAGDFSCDDWKIFVEGVGLYGDQVAWPGLEGHGADIFKWAVLVDPALVGSTADYVAARAAITRIQPAHTRGFLVFKMPGGSVCAIVDQATVDACLVC